MRPPRVSVVLAVFNREVLVQRAVRSILQQDFEDFELIIIDDGSDDRTAEAIRDFDDPRTRLVGLPVNSGVAVARNVGLNLARGKFIATMDSDDVAMPNRLGKQYDFLMANPGVTILGSHVIKVMGSRDIVLRHSSDDATIKARLLALNGSAMIHPTTMLRGDFVRRNNLRYPMMRTDSDHGFWIEAMLCGARFSLVEEVLLHYHRHRDNLTAETMPGYSDHERRKTPVRARLLGLFYPFLTHHEADLIARLMERGRQHVPNDISEAAAAIRKTAMDTKSHWGESKVALAQILEAYSNAGTLALSQES